MKLGAEFKPRLATTPIGSVPYTDPGEAVETFLGLFSEVPAWPQLPRRNPSENMVVQFAKTMPGASWDGEHLVFSKDGSFYEKLEKILEAQAQVDSGDPSALEVFALDPSAAAGFYEFIERAAGSRPAPLMVKGQITGPISLALTAVDADKKPIFYDDELVAMVNAYLPYAARWQAATLQKVHRRACVFIDEPMMSAYGSAFYSGLNEGVVTEAINAVADALHAQGAYAGVHAGCAGTTDWGLLLRTNIDILNFDAYEHFETFTLYPDDLRSFAEAGGILAWGLAPNDERVNDEATDALASRFESYLTRLGELGLDGHRVAEASMITPACGVGGLSRELACKILETTRDVAVELRARVLT